MGTLEVVSVLGNTFLPSCDKVNEALGVKILRKRAKHLPCFLLKSHQIGETPSSQLLLELRKHRKIARCEVRGVGGVGQKVNPPLPQLPKSEHRYVGTRIVLMQEEGVAAICFPGPQVGSFAAH